ncbi:MAG: aminotransferase class I/II-fold pyridoxal phosphate-dependent enzyme [Actinomycetales bacterium]|nr:aminotransferase class I/II-fold pyridoxal phosphate-dependent enzyme [Actinomycetales bacterium]
MSDSNVQAAPNAELLARHSSKYRRYAADVLPMHVAEMDFQIAQPIKAMLHDFVERNDLGYLGPIPELGEAFAGFAKRHWNWDVNPRNFKLATDVAVATVEFIRANSKPGDKVVISSPVYSSFFRWIEEPGLVLVDAPLRRNESAENVAHWALDLHAIEAAFAAGAKFYLMCQPQNPVGRIHSREELIRLAELAEHYSVVVISDEIHAPLTYAGEEFVPYLSVSDAARRTGICITSSSKSFNLAGLKAAILVWDSPEIAALVKNIIDDTHWRSSILGAFAMEVAFRHGDEWLAGCVRTLDENRHHMLAELHSKLPGVIAHLPQNGYLSLWDVTALNLGDDPAAAILRDAKVAVVPGPDMGGANYKNFIRFNFAASKQQITDAIDRIAAIVK